MGALRKEIPIEPYIEEEQQQEFFLLDETNVIWKIAIFIMFVGIGFILSTGLING